MPPRLASGDGPGRGRATGRAIRCIDMPRKVYDATLTEAGVSGADVSLGDDLFATILDGRHANRTDGVQRAPSWVTPRRILRIGTDQPNPRVVLGRARDPMVAVGRSSHRRSCVLDRRIKRKNVSGFCAEVGARISSIDGVFWQRPRKTRALYFTSEVVTVATAGIASGGVTGRPHGDVTRGTRGATRPRSPILCATDRNVDPRRLHASCRERSNCGAGQGR